MQALFHCKTTMHIIQDSESEAINGGNGLTLPTISTNVDINLINQIQNAAALGLLGGNAATGQVQGGGIFNLPLFIRR